MNPFESAQLKTYIDLIRSLLLDPQAQIILGTALLSLLSGAIIFTAFRLRQTGRLLNRAQRRITELEQEQSRQQIREAKLVTLLTSERKSSKEKLALLEEAREQLRLQFAALAQDIFEDKSSTFNTQSKERLESLLSPFNQQLVSLQQEIRQTYLDDTRERASLKQELNQLQELNRKMNEEAINLTRALKGDRKLQGNWGELVLERVLEQSGLRREHEYETQKGYRDSEQKLFKPDVVIHLPEGKDIIIDSKVSLSAWERFCKAADDHQRSRALNELTLAIRTHIKSLGVKQYEDLQGLNSLDFVLMFMPIEAAYLTAFSHDETLLTESLNQRVVIVTPTSLIATLRTVESIWRYEHQSRNSLEIARKAGTLYDKFRGFVEDMDRLGRQLENCRQSYDGAMNKLSQGRGNLIAQAQHLTELGVQVKKELPRNVTEQAETELRN